MLKLRALSHALRKWIIETLGPTKVCGARYVCSIDHGELVFPFERHERGPKANAVCVSSGSDQVHKYIYPSTN